MAPRTGAPHDTRASDRPKEELLPGNVRTVEPHGSAMGMKP